MKKSQLKVKLSIAQSELMLKEIEIKSLNDKLNINKIVHPILAKKKELIKEGWKLSDIALKLTKDKYDELLKALHRTNYSDLGNIHKLFGLDIKLIENICEVVVKSGSTRTLDFKNIDFSNFKFSVPTFYDGSIFRQWEKTVKNLPKPIIPKLMVGPVEYHALKLFLMTQNVKIDDFIDAMRKMPRKGDKVKFAKMDTLESDPKNKVTNVIVEEVKVLRLLRNCSNCNNILNKINCQDCADCSDWQPRK